MFRFSNFSADFSIIKSKHEYKSTISFIKTTLPVKNCEVVRGNDEIDR